MSDNCNSGSFATGLLIGAVVGGALALLYAPQSGKETRKYVSKKALEVKDKAIDFAEDAKDQAVELKGRAEKAVKAAEKEIKG